VTPAKAQRKKLEAELKDLSMELVKLRNPNPDALSPRRTEVETRLSELRVALQSLERERERALQSGLPDPDPLNIGRGTISETKRCVAIRHSSGTRCRNAHNPGMTVCDRHGGKAPQIVKSAKTRLEDLTHPAISALRDVINAALETGDHTNVLRACQLVLDRTGFHPKQDHSINASGLNTQTLGHLNSLSTDELLARADELHRQIKEFSSPKAQLRLEIDSMKEELVAEEEI